MRLRSITPLGLSPRWCAEMAVDRAVPLPWGWRRLARHARCAARWLALLPLGLLAGMAWLAATLLAGAWTGLVLPPRRGGPTTLD